MFTGYHQKNKDRLLKKARERYQNRSYEEKKIVNKPMNHLEIFQKVKNISLMCMEKLF